VLNSPLANAFTYCHTLQKHIYDSLIASLPLPVNWQLHVEPVVQAANAYLSQVRQPAAFVLAPDRNSTVCEALLEMDAAVMRAYALPAQHERDVLDLFGLTGTKTKQRRRKGVGCRFAEYFPRHLTKAVHLSDLVAATHRWKDVNRRRGLLIEREIEGKLTPHEVVELEQLQSIADLRTDLLFPIDLSEFTRFQVDLRKVSHD
jgi:hypothetical protein